MCDKKTVNKALDALGSALYECSKIQSISRELVYKMVETEYIRISEVSDVERIPKFYNEKKQHAQEKK